MYRILMTILGAVGVAWGVAALLAPNLLAAIYGGDLNPIGRTFTNVGGAIALGFGLMDWSVRALQEVPLRRRILIANLAAVGLVSVSLLIGTVSGSIGSLGWIGAILHAILAGGLVAAIVREADDAVGGRR